MPASVSIGPDPATAAAAARKQAFFRRLLKAYDKGEPLRADVSAGSYGRRDSSGTLVLTQCNLFFVEPAAPR
jgi:hypothetical protein